MKARVFRARETVADVPIPAATPVVASPAQLEQLPTGIQLEGQNPPVGWSHLVFKSIPKLTSGDLDTVSAQAFEIAQRIRPLMVAEVRRASDDPRAPFHLKRVGVGLCAPGKEEGSDVVISTMSIAGTRGEWTTKQRLILAALSYESAKAKMTAATSTFALVRTPVVFLAEGQHRKLDLCYALRVDPQTGELETIVWPDLGSTTGGKPVTGHRPPSCVRGVRLTPGRPRDPGPGENPDRLVLCDPRTPRWPGSQATSRIPEPGGFGGRERLGSSAAIEQSLMSLSLEHKASTEGVARAGR